MSVGVSKSEKENLRKYTLEGKWEDVISMYEEIPEVANEKIMESSRKEKCIGTALHMAVTLDEESVVRRLVNAILDKQRGKEAPEALKIGNERGDTPLHIAAAKGFVLICMAIIGRNEARKDLVEEKNNKGETPLFQAAINGQKLVFSYLSNILHHKWSLSHLVRENGDTILHCAIRRDYFELAVMIQHYYGHHISTNKNRTALQALAARPLAFKSSTYLPWWKEIMYRCIIVDKVDAKRKMQSNLVKIWKMKYEGKDSSLESWFLQNYLTILILVIFAGSAFCIFYCVLLVFAICLFLVMIGLILVMIGLSPVLIGFLLLVFGLLALVYGVVRYFRGGNKEENKNEKENDNENEDENEIQNQNDIESVPHQNENQNENENENQNENENENEIKDNIESVPSPRYLPRNYATTGEYFNLARTCITALFRKELKEVKKIKKKHRWGDKLFKELMIKVTTEGDEDRTSQDEENQRKPGEKDTPDSKVDVIGNTTLSVSEEIDIVEKQGKPGENDTPDSKVDVIGNTTLSVSAEMEIVEKQGKPGENDTPDSKVDVGNKKLLVSAEIGMVENQGKPLKKDTQGSKVDVGNTTFLVSAENGIVEMVVGILDKIPSVIHDTNDDNENVMHVAVRNRKSQVVEELKKKYESKLAMWNTLIMAQDKNRNTVLHLAADLPKGDKPWQLSGYALQMMWDVKWFQYIKDQVPQYFCALKDIQGRTPEEIFKETHGELQQESGKWLKDTCDSCSVVAALVASVSYATVSSIPGGTNDQGMPHLEDRSAFQTFVVATLMGLCFSVTGIVTFLSVRTSRKQAKDFAKSVPFHLLVGLGFLFLSVVSMVVSFCAGHSLEFNRKFQKTVFPIYVAIFLPLLVYALTQLPIFFDLLAAIRSKVPKSNNKADSL